MFQSVFRLVNTWVLLWEGFQGKPDVLERVETCLGWVLIHSKPKNGDEHILLHPFIRMLHVCVCLLEYSCLYICIDVHTDACFSMHTCTWSMHMHALSTHMHTWVWKRSFMPIMCCFTFLSPIFVQYDSYAPVFVFRKVCDPTRVGVALAFYLDGIGPWQTRRRLWRMQPASRHSHIFFP